MAKKRIIQLNLGFKVKGQLQKVFKIPLLDSLASKSFRSTVIRPPLITLDACIIMLEAFMKTALKG